MNENDGAEAMNSETNFVTHLPSDDLKSQPSGRDRRGLFTQPKETHCTTKTATNTELFIIGPGPFAYRESQCGVDLTFDVYCETTGNVITSFRFWEARTESLNQAIYLTNALELLRQNRIANEEYRSF